jgi:tetratricopeptide (TPR) repeat protein
MRQACLLLFALPLFTLLCACGGATEPTNQAGNPPGQQVEVTASERLNRAGDSAVHVNNYDQAIALFQQAMDSAALHADSFDYYDSRLDLACVYDRLGELDKSIAIGTPVLEAYVRSGDSSRIGRAYSTMSAFYGRANKPDEAFDMARKGFDILRQQGSEIERCAAYNQMAFTFSDDGRWEEALPLLDTALMLMRRSGTLTQLPGMCLNIGNCHREIGNMPEARRYLLQAVALCDSTGQMHIKARSLERLSQIAEAQGDANTALPLYRKAVMLKDSVFKADRVKRQQDLEVQYKTREKEQEILLLRAEKHVAAVRRTLTWVLWGGTILAAVLSLLYWRAQARASSHALQHSRAQLQEFTEVLIEKNARLLELEQGAGQSSPRVSAPHPDLGAEEGKTALEGLDLYNFRILTDQDWRAFKQLFERSYPGYLYRLRTAHPDITGAEERLCLLLKINLQRQEIASILGVSESTVKKGRARLRRRLGLSEAQNLEDFLRDLR